MRMHFFNRIAFRDKFIILLLAITSFAPYHFVNANSDSLKNLIAKYPEKESLYLELLRSLYNEKQYEACANIADSLHHVKKLITAEYTAEIYLYKGLSNNKLANYDTAMVYLKKSIEINEPIFTNDTSKVTLADKLNEAYFHLGILHEKYKQNNYEALSLYKKSLFYSNLTQNKRQKSIVLNSIGYIQADIGNMSEAITSLLTGLQLAEEINDPLQIAKLSMAIGYTYYYNQDFDNALKYYQKAKKFAETMDAKDGVSISLINIGSVYSEKEEFTKALEYYNKALELQNKSINNKATISSLYNNIGSIYKTTGEYKKALQYFEKALVISKETNNKMQMAISLSDIGNAYLNLNQFEIAEHNFKSALKLAEEIGFVQAKKEIYVSYYKLYNKVSDYKNALKYYIKYSELDDSIISIESNDKISELETKYQVEKKEQKIELQNKIIAQKEQIIKRKKSERNIFIISFTLLLIALIFIIATLNKIKQQRNNILHKNEILNQQKEEIRAQTETLNTTNRELIRNAKLKELFFANTSHEIRTPASIISGFSELLLKTKLSAKQKEYLNNIKNTSKTLLAIINDILDFSKIEANKMELESIDFNLDKIITGLYKNMSLQAKKKKIEFTLDKSDNLPPVIKGDPVRLNQVLSNLLSNAIKFTNPEGKVGLEVKNLKSDKNSITIQFIVSDSGIGILPNKLKNIFENYTQSDLDTTRKYGGTGLGLSIVKKLVEKQKGTILVNSEVGKGSIFTVVIPFNKSELQEIIEPIPIQANQEFKKLDHLNILIVDDNPVNRALTKDILISENENLSISEAENGKIALEQLSATSFDIVLMDLLMPVMDGYEATTEIRKNKNEKIRNIPILGVTANSLNEELNKCLKAGLNDCVTKPFKVHELIDKISQLVGLKK